MSSIRHELVYNLNKIGDSQLSREKINKTTNKSFMEREIRNRFSTIFTILDIHIYGSIMESRIRNRFATIVTILDLHLYGSIKSLRIWHTGHINKILSVLQCDRKIPVAVGVISNQRKYVRCPKSFMWKKERNISWRETILDISFSVIKISSTCTRSIIRPFNVFQRNNEWYNYLNPWLRIVNQNL